MIIYNIRYDGPYEYDKFILNIGQLYNIVYDEKKRYNAHEIHSYLKQLDEIIKDKVVCSGSEIKLMDRLCLIEKDRGKK